VELIATILVVGFFFVLRLALALAYSDNPRHGIPRVLHRLAFVLAEQVNGRCTRLDDSAHRDRCG
jgi:hypothetical protein